MGGKNIHDYISTKHCIFILISLIECFPMKADFYLQKAKQPNEKKTQRKKAPISNYIYYIKIIFCFLSIVVFHIINIIVF